MAGRMTAASRQSDGEKPKRKQSATQLANLTGGSRKGIPNKATGTLKALAQQYTPEAIATLAQIMTHGESEAARVSAANAILDRGYGKPAQSLQDSEGNALDWVAIIATARAR